MIERKRAVLGLFTVVNAKRRLKIVQAPVPAPQHAGHVRTDFNMVFALGLLMQHIVETDDRAHLSRCDPQDFRQFVLRIHRAVSELPLDNVERRQNPRTLPARRIACQNFVDLLPHLFRNH